jgi:integrase
MLCVGYRVGEWVKNEITDMRVFVTMCLPKTISVHYSGVQMDCVTVKSEITNNDIAVTKDISEIGTCNFKSLEKMLNASIQSFSKHQLESLNKTILQTIKVKYKHRRTPKYGMLNKGFSLSELNKFLSVIDVAKYKLLFAYQAYLALRIGEVCIINLNDFQFEKRQLKIHTEKGNFLAVLKIPPFLFKATSEYIQTYQADIVNAKGYLFYPDKKYSKSTTYLNINYARKVFRGYLVKAGLDETYDTSDESFPDRPKRKLHRLTTQSLRHYGITNFNREVNGNITWTQVFARHKEISSTLVYINRATEEVFNAIDSAYASTTLDLPKEIA